MKNSKLIGFMFASSAGILWGTYGTFVAILSQFGFSENAIATFAPIGMILLFFLFAIIHNPKGLIPNKKQLIVYIAVGIIGVLGTNLCYAYAIQSGVSVSMASVISFSNYFLVMIFSRLIWNIKITKDKLFAGIGTIIGIMLVLQVWTDPALSLIGAIWTIILTITFAISYTLANLAIDDYKTDPDAYYFWTNLIGFIILIFIIPPWDCIGEIATCYSSHGIICIIALIGFCLIPQTGSFYCLGRAFQYLEPPSVVIMYSLDPIVASILGFVVLGQNIEIIQILGIIIVLASISLVQIRDIKQGTA